MGGPDDTKVLACGDGLFNEVEEASVGLDRDDIEGDEGAGIERRADDVFVVGVENAEIVFRTVVGGGGDGSETQGGEPVIDLGLGDGDDLETRLRDADGEIVFLNHDPLQSIQVRGDQVLQPQPFEILIRRGFPKVESPRILVGWNEGQVNPRSETEDTLAGQLEVTPALDKDIMLLSPAGKSIREVGEI